MSSLLLHDLDWLTEYDLIRLKEWCPNLTALTLPMNEIPTATMALWCGALKNLKQLLLLSAPVDSIEILRQAPGLDFLGLFNMSSPSMHMLEYTEAVYACCPCLETFYLSLRAEDDNPSPVLISDDFFDNIKPAKAMKEIAFIPTDRLYHYPQLLMYVAYKYPCLRHLNMSQIGVRKFGNVKPTIDPFMLLAMRCPQLQGITWRSLCHSGVRMYDALAASGTNVTKLHIDDYLGEGDVPPFRASNAYAALLRSALRHTVTDLTFQYNGCLAMAPDEILSDFGQLPGLTRLSLIGINQCPESESYSVDLFLDCCPHLAELVLDRINLHTVALEAQSTRHPLRRFEIMDGYLTKDVLPYFSARCRHLMHVSLSVCTLEAHDHEIRIELPFSSLSFVYINNITGLVKGGIVKFVAYTGTLERSAVPPLGGTSAQWHYIPKSRRSVWEPKRLAAPQINPLGRIEARLAQQLVQLPRTGTFGIKKRYRHLCPDGKVSQPPIWNPLDLCHGYIHLVCLSVKHLYYNGKAVRT
ncbi:hypothetical protein DFQ28_000855 [Apophysomyces sp. BC1034]|nr:hypothetical protein DFQ30_006916 [Apophysomyces sp. BC1015]KAG0181096.1 hypothetical protein DFQ29_009327 [Apophysomyces sp. BC1021]KAG0191152.1 hypothetical protein DFQ28_000855 [Apophysomyces sp. BC1034]